MPGDERRRGWPPGRRAAAASVREERARCPSHSVSSAALGPATRAAVGEHGVVVFGRGLAAASSASVARSGRARCDERAQAAARARETSNMLSLPAGALVVADLQRGVGARCGGGEHVAQDAVVQLAHRLHVVGPDQLQHVDRAQRRVGERHRLLSGPRRRRDRSRRPCSPRRPSSGSTSPSQASSAGSAVRPRRWRRRARLSPGLSCSATRWVSPIPAVGVCTTSGSGGKVAAGVGVERRRRPVRSCPAPPGARPRPARGRRSRRRRRAARSPRRRSPSASAAVAVGSPSTPNG